jgi:hypothetical protein
VLDTTIHKQTQITIWTLMEVKTNRTSFLCGYRNGYYILGWNITIVFLHLRNIMIPMLKLYTNCNIASMNYKTKTKTAYWKYQVYIQWCLPHNEKILTPIVNCQMLSYTKTTGVVCIGKQYLSTWKSNLYQGWYSLFLFHPRYYVCNIKCKIFHTHIHHHLLGIHWR